MLLIYPIVIPYFEPIPALPSLWEVAMDLLIPEPVEGMVGQAFLAEGWFARQPLGTNIMGGGEVQFRIFVFSVTSSTS